MKVEKRGDGFSIEKELEPLDRFVLDFVEALDEAGVDYVIVSGYVSILFGRSRSSEDVDFLVGRMSEKAFATLWKSMKGRFDCVITDDPSSAYKDYLMDKLAIRFARQNELIPNAEIKFPATSIDAWTLKNSLNVRLNGQNLRISPIELQIVYKLYLGSDKDIEDAKHLYVLLKDHLDLAILENRLKDFKQQASFKRHLK